MTPDTPPGVPAPRPSSPGTPAPPAPPRPELLGPQASESLLEYLRRRMEVMDRELTLERDRAREAEGLLRRQDAMRTEVDGQLKALLEQLRQEKSLRENEEEKSHARGRIDSLETRLDQMHQTWAGLLKEALARREAGDASIASASAAASEGIRSLGEGLGALRRDLQGLRESLAAVPAKLLPELGELRDRLPLSDKLREEGDRVLAESLRDMVSNFGAALSDRLGEMDRRLAMEMEKHRERLEALTRERALMAAALEEERHRVRQEYAKERQALQADFNAQLSEIGKSLGQLQAGQHGAGLEAAALKGIVGKIHDILTQPEAAKEQIIQELEQEKRDLMKALKDRAEELRRYTLERREVERSLGESLMDMNRKLEAERLRQEQLQARISELQLRLEGQEGEKRVLEGRIEMAQRAAQAQEARFAALAAERDELLKALLAETQKVQNQLETKTAGDKAWEERLAAADRLLGEEKERRRADEYQLAELRAQLQSLTDQLTRVLRDKEKVESDASRWTQERDALLANLRKKDEMIAMLSSTFQNMLKK